MRIGGHMLGIGDAIDTSFLPTLDTSHVAVNPSPQVSPAVSEAALDNLPLLDPRAGAPVYTPVTTIEPTPEGPTTSQGVLAGIAAASILLLFGLAMGGGRR